MLCTLTGVPGGPCGPGISVASAPLTYTICDAEKKCLCKETNKSRLNDQRLTVKVKPAQVDQYCQVSQVGLEVQRVLQVQQGHVLLSAHHSPDKKGRNTTNNDDVYVSQLPPSLQGSEELNQSRWCC